MEMNIDAVQKDDDAGTVVKTEAKKKNDNDVVDIHKLTILLEASKKAGDLIACKDIMLLIGLTGAGKVSRIL